MTEKFSDYSRIEPLLEGVSLPRMFRVLQTFPRDRLEDVAGETRRRLEASGAAALVRPGMTVAVTGSSRGIANMNVVLREAVSFLRRLGAEPFLIPAMGSHGGSTAEGQRRVLEGYGITEEFCGCPIRSSMETVCLGEAPEEGGPLPVYIDRLAFEADGIVAVNRVKPHSAFRGPVESGLTKMLCVGLGKQKGADSIHKDGFGTFATRIPLAGNYVRTHTNVLFGVALVENAYDETNRVEVLRSEEIPEREPALLEYARSLMPRILVPETDVLVVREIGKNFSGSGMDPNVTGTFGTPYATGGIRKQRTVVLDISPESHGSYIGLGKADVSTKRVFEKLDTNATYFNMITSTVLNVGKIPMILEDDKLALQTAVKTLTQVDRDHIRLVYIKNTLSLENIIVSEALAEEIRGREDMEVLEEPRPLRFDERGTLLDFLD